MPLLERLRRDFVVLRQLARGMPHAAEHAQRLQAFYAPQADHYDAFRDRLLPGRAELVDRLPLPEENAHIVELGGGTGRNAEFFRRHQQRVAAIEIVDLCPALLDIAHRRASIEPRLRVIQADATTYRPAAAVDCVYFSYALTMIPDWQAALRNAHAMLKPGGVIGVVDFYVPPQSAGGGALAAIDRVFWRRWFAHDGVSLNPEHRSALRGLFPRHEMIDRRAPVPYLPVARVPYYIFVGYKNGAGTSA